MPVNGTEMLNDPWNTTFSPFTNMFQDVIGNGQVFFLFPLIILTIGIQIKTENSIMTSLFMIASGALLGTGGLFAGATSMAMLFTIFAAMGLVGLFLSLIFQR